MRSQYSVLKYYVSLNRAQDGRSTRRDGGRAVEPEDDKDGCFRAYQVGGSSC